MERQVSRRLLSASRGVGRRKNQKHGIAIRGVSMKELPPTGPQAGLLESMPRVVWAVAQMDPDGGEEPWYGVAGNMPIEPEVQRTIKRADI